MKELHQNEKLKQPETDAKTQEISYEYKKKKAHSLMEKLSPTNEAVGLRNNLFLNVLPKSSGVISSKNEEESKKKTHDFMNVTICPTKKMNY